ncbi:MAG: TRAP transporter small permease [Lachnospiraceae bacterium]|nr:TRAP transporter small permease [Lachnospiraceae bacterium]
MKASKIWRILSDYIFSIVGVIGLAVMLAVAFGNVLSRYVLPVSWAFTEELTCGLFILVSMLGAALAVKDEKAMGISLITDHFPKSWNKYMLIIHGLFSGFFGFLLLRYGIDMVKSELRLKMKTAALQWPEAIFGSFIPIGGAALMIGSLGLIIKGVSEIRKVHSKKGGEA